MIVQHTSKPTRLLSTQLSRRTALRRLAGGAAFMVVPAFQEPEATGWRGIAVRLANLDWPQFTAECAVQNERGRENTFERIVLPPDPGRRIRYETNSIRAFVLVKSQFEIEASNPLVGWPAVSIENLENRRQELVRGLSVGETVTWIQREGRVVSITRQSDSRDYKELDIDFRSSLA